MPSWRVTGRSVLRRVLGAGLRVLPVRVVRTVFEAAQEQLHRRGPDFVTSRTLPKSGAVGPYRVLDPVLPPAGRGPVAIVLQGPLLLDDDFTVETVRYYSRLGPSVAVVVSTWAGEDAAALERIRSLGADVVLSEKPPFAGRINVNLQACSTAAGIRRAIEKGCHHVAKTRTDQRVYCLPAVLALPRLLGLFPARNAPGQHARLVAVSWGTAAFCPCYLADQFMFGTCNDMLAFWSPPWDETNEGRAAVLAARDRAATVAEASAFAPEHYLVSEYLKRDGRPPPVRLADWWRALADRFAVVNWADLDLYWPKVQPCAERRDYEHDDHPIAHPLRSWDWLSLVAGDPGDPPAVLVELLHGPPDGRLPPRLHTGERG